jgi:hypothetical protein
MVKIYLDDVRTPLEDGWIVVRNYIEFVDEVNKHGLDNISTISLDHDLGDEAMTEYYSNVKHNNELDYNNISEKTGMDCCKFLVNKSVEENKTLPQIYVHSANPIGSYNMMSFINSYLKFSGEMPTCEKIKIPHSLHESHTIPLEERRLKWDKFFKLNKPKTDD